MVPIAVAIGFIIAGIVVSFSGDSAQPQYMDVVPSDVPEYRFENGKVLYYTINGGNSDDSVLKIYNSSQYSSSERHEFLTYLKNNYSCVNIDKMENEWKWHNFAYRLQYRQENTASVDMYFNKGDEGHGFFSWVINHCYCWF